MNFKKLRDVKTPLLATDGSAGYDLYLPEDSYPLVIHPKQTYKIMTGVAVAIPKFNVGFLLPRSSTGCAGMTLQNSIGVIDSDYKQEIQARIRNWSETEDLVINPGERFAQLVVTNCITTEVQVVDEFNSAGRVGGFGSSGKS